MSYVNNPIKSIQSTAYFCYVYLLLAINSVQIVGSIFIELVMTDLHSVLSSYLEFHLVWLILRTTLLESLI
jgi:hypothetical protein